MLNDILLWSAIAASLTLSVIALFISGNSPQCPHNRIPDDFYPRVNLLWDAAHPWEYEVVDIRETIFTTLRLGWRVKRSRFLEPDYYSHIVHTKDEAEWLAAAALTNPGICVWRYERKDE